MKQTTQAAGNVFWKVAGIAFSLLILFLIGYAISRGWKKGQESNYCIDGNKNCYQY